MTDSVGSNSAKIDLSKITLLTSKMSGSNDEQDGQVAIINVDGNQLTEDSPKTIPELQEKWATRPHTKRAIC